MTAIRDVEFDPHAATVDAVQRAAYRLSDRYTSASQIDRPMLIGRASTVRKLTTRTPFLLRFAMRCWIKFFVSGFATRRPRRAT